MLKKKEKIIVVRSNTRILPEQKKYIEDLVKKTGHSEGHIIREMLQYYIDSHK